MFIRLNSVNYINILIKKSFFCIIPAHFIFGVASAPRPTPSSFPPYAPPSPAHLLFTHLGVAGRVIVALGYESQITVMPC